MSSRVAGIRLDGADVVRGAGGRPTERRHPVGRPVPVQQRAVRRGVQAGRRGRVQRGGGRGRQQTRLVQLRGPERPEAHRHLHGRQGRLQGHRRPFARRPDTGPGTGRARGPGAQVPVAGPVVSVADALIDCCAPSSVRRVVGRVSTDDVAIDAGVHVPRHSPQHPRDATPHFGVRSFPETDRIVRNVSFHLPLFVDANDHDYSSRSKIEILNKSAERRFSEYVWVFEWFLRRAHNNDCTFSIVYFQS